MQDFVLVVLLTRNGTFVMRTMYPHLLFACAWASLTRHFCVEGAKRWLLDIPHTVCKQPSTFTMFSSVGV